MSRAPDPTKSSPKAGDDDWSDDERLETQSEDVALVLAPCRDVPTEGGDGLVAVSIMVPDLVQRVPADICCVIDVSGSMCSAAKYEKDGEMTDDGWSILDIVKHAVKTVLKALQEQDRLSLVAFGCEARTILELTPMTVDGQARALEALDSLHPGGRTNIWAGILAALDALRAGSSGTSGAQRLRSILLLTDGEPTVIPPRGHTAELRDYMDTHSAFSCQLNTFGFGYTLDSELLLDLAKEGNGTYAFIPDSLIVGTAFVNCIANTLCTLTQNATLSLVPCQGASFTGSVLADFAELDESWGKAVSLGPLQYGQSRDVVVPIRVPLGTEPYLEAILTYPRANGSAGRVVAKDSSRRATPESLVACCRAMTVTAGYNAVKASVVDGRGEPHGEVVADLCVQLGKDFAGLSSSPSKACDELLALKSDVEGRMTKALNGSERFNRWGLHYLRALMRSHQLQVCTNYMDPGLQLYGGTLFRSLRDVGDRIFLSLQQPTKSRVRGAAAPTPQPWQASTEQPTQPYSAPEPQNEMNTYYAGGGGG